MKANKSPLMLNDFLLLKSNYQFIQPENPDFNLGELMDQYPIDLDFTVQRVQDNLFHLYTKIHINQETKPLPGYILFIEGVSLFSFDEKVNLNEEEKANLLHFSGLNITINSLRNILASLTANGPFNKYTLPSIDVNKLLDDKKKLLEEKE